MSPGRVVSFAIAFSLGLGLVGPPAASAVQAGASLSVIPDNWGFLTTGQTIDVLIRANNTSSDTPSVTFPGDGSGAKAATLSGPITVTLGCADDACSTLNSGVLAFVPVGGSGCVSQNAAVTTCASGGAGQVLINFGSPITLPPAGSVDIATIRVQVVDATLVASTGIRAMTEVGAVTACSTSLPSFCVSCHADGCTRVAFTAPANIRACPHACPSVIRFREGALDSFVFHADLVTAPGFDPANQPLTVTLSNALFNPILTYTLPPGSLVPQTDSFKYLNASARNTGGFSIVTVGRRDATTNVYKIALAIYDPNLEARATLPDMTTTIQVGGQTFSVSGTWTKTNSGWVFNIP